MEEEILRNTEIEVLEEIWEKRYRMLHGDADISEKIRIVEESADAVESVWARICLMDAACERVAGYGLGNAGRKALYEALITYVYECINKWAPSYVKTGSFEKNKENRTGMVNSAFVQIYENMDKYDPVRSRLTTFFKWYIKSGIFDWVNESRDTTKSISSRMSRVQKTMDALIAQGRPATVEEVRHELPMLSISQITSAMKAIEEFKSKLCLEDETSEIIPSQALSPEDEFIKNEQKKLLYDAIESLPEPFRTVYCLSNGISLEDRSIYEDECLKSKEISRIVGYSANDVNQIKADARRKVMHFIARANGQTVTHKPKVYIGVEIPFLNDDDDDVISDYLDSITSITCVHPKDEEAQDA